MSEEIKITITETENAFIVNGNNGSGDGSSATFFKTNPLAEHLAKEQVTKMKTDFGSLKNLREKGLV